jgi:5-methylcytosine-specific restriction protein A
VIKADWLKEDPISRDLPNLKMRQQTNYKLDIRQAQRLARLWSRTGSDFDRTDLLISLRAYEDTFDQSVSKLPGSPVADAAIVAGRAVSSIYAKVMNFRAQDPRVEGTGQANAGAPTEEIWAEFWNGNEIDRARLEAAISAMLYPGSEPESLRSLEAEVDTYEGYSPEGRRRLVTHFKVERNRQVVEDAKAAWFAHDPFMHCCVCKMSFLKTYGPRGHRFIEAHHRHRKVSDLEVPTIPKIQDFAPVCANCHRMLHRSENISIESLVKAIDGAKKEGW